MQRGREDPSTFHSRLLNPPSPPWWGPNPWRWPSGRGRCRRCRRCQSWWACCTTRCCSPPDTPARPAPPRGSNEPSSSRPGTKPQTKQLGTVYAYCNLTLKTITEIVRDTLFIIIIISWPLNTKNKKGVLKEIVPELNQRQKSLRKFNKTC